MQLRSQPANHGGGNAALVVEDEDKASRTQHLLQYAIEVQLEIDDEQK